MGQGFYQRRHDLMGHILDSRALTVAQKCVGLKVLVAYMNSQTELAWMSPGRLARELDLHVDTVRVALKALEREAFLDGQRERGRTTVFRMGVAYRFTPRSSVGQPPAPRPGHPRRDTRGTLRREYEENPLAERRDERRPAVNARRSKPGYQEVEHEPDEGEEW